MEIMSSRLHAVAMTVLEKEAHALEEVRRLLKPEVLMSAVRLIANHHMGQVMTTGIGKSGLVAQRIAGTLRVVGVRAWFLHLPEALHGDVGGMNTGEDVLLICSRSGESEELRGLLDYAEEWAVPIIAITAGEGSMLAQAAEVVLLHGGEEIACPLGLTPTSSVTAAAGLGDALAIALQVYLGFSAKDFAALHSDGTLGRRLTLRVKDVMVTWPHYIGVVRPETAILEAMILLARKRGTLVVIDGETEKFLGVVTAGDVARYVVGKTMPVDLESPTHVIMEGWEQDNIMATGIVTREPHVIAPDALVIQAIELMQLVGIMALPVLDDGCVLGMIHLHDALKARVQ